MRGICVFRNRGGAIFEKSSRERLFNIAPERLSGSRVGRESPGGVGCRGAGLAAGNRAPGCRQEDYVSSALGMRLRCESRS